jgi:hypothetical protein
MVITQNRIAVCILLLLVALIAPVSPQETKDIVVHANGDGTIKIGDEEFKLTSVVVKLFSDSKAEINLISDITIFISGTWSRATNSSNQINLKITGGATGGGVEAAGELLITDRKSIDRMSLQGTTKTTHRELSVTFQAK